jgi:NAD(P)-dependent dehydrogenase (short-subunit alcohol dehydrogenase family)
VTRVAGAVAVVTGGASGIGYGIAEQLAAAGATVVIADIEPGALGAAAEQLGVVGIEVDVADLASVVNNAGVGPLGLISDLSIDDWRWILDVNLYGVVHGVLVFLPLLKANPDGGHIVNTGSQAAFDPLETMGAYSSAKFAVAALTEVLRAELATEGSLVTATLLAPGPVFSNIKHSTRNRPAGQVGGLRDADLAASMDTTGWMQPSEVGRIAVRAIEHDVAIAPTHPALLPSVEARFDRIRADYTRFADAPA